MKGSVQWSTVQPWAEFYLQGNSNLGPRDPNLYKDVSCIVITKTRLFKYIKNFTTK